MPKGVLQQAQVQGVHVQQVSLRYLTGGGVSGQDEKPWKGNDK